MNDSEILNLINGNKKLQLEVEELRKQLNEIATNSKEDMMGREDSVKIFIDSL